MLKTGDNISHYKIIAAIGAGIGEVYKELLDNGPRPLQKVTKYAQQFVSGLSVAF